LGKGGGEGKKNFIGDSLLEKWLLRRGTRKAGFCSEDIRTGLKCIWQKKSGWGMGMNKSYLITIHLGRIEELRKGKKKVSKNPILYIFLIKGCQ